MPISKKRLEEIKAFKTTDFSDCPELTDEQLAQMKPSHLRKANKKNEWDTFMHGVNSFSEDFMSEGREQNTDNNKS